VASERSAPDCGRRHGVAPTLGLRRSNPDRRSRVSEIVSGEAARGPRWRVALVDGYPLARAGLKAFFASAPDMVVVGEAADGDEALRLAADAAPDLVVLGFDLLDGPNGVEVCRALKALRTPPRILVLAGHNHDEALLPFFVARADSYLHRRSDRDAIVDGARRTAAGRRVWDIADHVGEVTPIVRAGPESIGLTARELEVLTLKHHRLTNADIAARLNISRHTVKHHVTSIKRKLSTSFGETRK
jgi:DNA-binding NarL/FixJ family response regulator